jgi:L-histidine N-alpha-methyltransferase
MLHTDSQVTDLSLGLQSDPRWIPSKYFYDDRGSALFDQICDLPEYYPYRTEQALLDEVAPEVAELTRAVELVELGSGTGRKARTLIGALLAQGNGCHYCPLDISEFALRQATAAVAAAFPEVRITGIACDYLSSLEALTPDPGCLAAFLGSTIGNFRHVDGVRLLRRLHDQLAGGDWFLLGVDLVKPVAVLEAAYNDAAGLTARFNKNILSVVNREANGDFDPEGFEHLAFFDPEASQIEMHLVARQAQRVRLRALDLELELERGERIRTEISRKFTRASAGRMLVESGFDLQHWFPSRNGYFALALASVEA